MELRSQRRILISDNPSCRRPGDPDTERQCDSTEVVARHMQRSQIDIGSADGLASAGFGRAGRQVARVSDRRSPRNFDATRANENAYRVRPWRGSTLFSLRNKLASRRFYTAGSSVRPSLIGSYRDPPTSPARTRRSPCLISTICVRRHRKAVPHGRRAAAQQRQRPFAGSFHSPIRANRHKQASPRRRLAFFLIRSF